MRIAVFVFFCLFQQFTINQEKIIENNESFKHVVTCGLF